MAKTRVLAILSAVGLNQQVCIKLSVLFFSFLFLLKNCEKFKLCKQSSHFFPSKNGNFVHSTLKKNKKNYIHSLKLSQEFLLSQQFYGAFLV